MPRRTPQISASLMCADFTRLGEQLADLHAAGIRRLHLDFVDGHFAPNIGLGTEIFALLAGYPDFRLESHLTVEAPQRLLHLFVPRSTWVIFHPEATPDPKACIEAIRLGGARPGIALKPETPVDVCLSLLPHLDLVDILTVPPGFAGGVYDPETLAKVEQLRREVDRRGLQVEIEVDGGVNSRTIPAMLQAGADVLVGGSSGLFTGDSLRRQAQALQALLGAT
jgi:ribulose-phosphate 3-epimerase